MKQTKVIWTKEEVYYDMGRDIIMGHIHLDSEKKRLFLDAEQVKKILLDFDIDLTISFTADKNLIWQKRGEAMMLDKIKKKLWLKEDER